MKVISFSEIDFVKKILVEEKTQTIRLLKEIHFCSPECCPDNRDWDRPRFKVGEQVKLVYKMRSKYKVFCMDCGKGMEAGKAREHNEKCWKEAKGLVGIAVPKHFATAEITDVSIIDGNFQRDFLTEELAKRDGFNSARDMFKWFDKAYDLSTPKKFCVYRWRLV